jgi:hypothetical protein
MRVVKEFERHFRALEAAMNIEGQLKGSPSENFDKLHKFSEDRIFAASLMNYGHGRISMLRAGLDASLEHAPQIDYFYEVIDFIFHNLCASVSHRYIRNSAPKVHHWLPVSYTRHFATSSKGRKAGPIHCVKFSKNGQMFGTDVTDRHFAHAKESNGDGFYHLSMEKFFCLVEMKMGEARTKLELGGKHPENFSSVTTAAFFIVQSVRNPSPGHESFSIRNIGGVVAALIEVIEKFKKIHCIFAVPQNRKKLVFTPYVPTRIRVLSDGTRAVYFPFAPNRGFIITDRVILNNTAMKIVEESNIAVVNHARRTASLIYGANSHQVARHFE